MSQVPRLRSWAGSLLFRPYGIVQKGSTTPRCFIFVFRALPLSEHHRRPRVHITSRVLSNERLASLADLRVLLLYEAMSLSTSQAFITLMLQDNFARCPGPASIRALALPWYSRPLDSIRRSLAHKRLSRGVIGGVVVASRATVGLVPE